MKAMTLPASSAEPPPSAMTPSCRPACSACEPGLDVRRDRVGLHVARTRRPAMPSPAQHLERALDRRQRGEPRVGDEQRPRHAGGLHRGAELGDAPGAEADRGRIVPVADELHTASPYRPLRSGAISRHLLYGHDRESSRRPAIRSPCRPPRPPPTPTPGSAHGRARCATHPAERHRCGSASRPAAPRASPPACCATASSARPMWGRAGSRNRNPGIRSAAARRRCSRPSHRTACTTSPALCRSSATLSNLQHIVQPSQFRPGTTSTCWLIRSLSTGAAPVPSPHSSWGGVRVRGGRLLQR